MPIVVIPIKSRDQLLKIARELHVAKADGRHWGIHALQWQATGFLGALRSMCPSETVDLLEADYDRVVKGGDENP